jgi:hypothetical protein
MRRFSVATVIVCLAVLPCVGLILPSILGATNCGGNSAALAHVSMYSKIVYMVADRRPDHTFSLASATPEERERIASITHPAWIGTGRYLISTQPVRVLPGEPRRMVIVCNRPFRNVPRRYLFANPPTHAVAYSDGTIELISEECYAALDRSSFIPADQWLAKTEPQAPTVD